MKILNRSELIVFCENARKRGKKIVFTNGCFDILHRGHIDYLKAAEAFGDILVVGLNTDASVKRIKDKGRPITTEDDRAAIVSALRFVDAVCLFDEDTPLELIKAIKPDVLVKGSDYSVETIVGYDEVTKNGGQVVTIPLTVGKSTTALIQWIKEMED